MKEQLDTFIRIAKELMNEEANTPVLKPMDPEQVFKDLDLELGNSGIDTDRLESALKELVLNTPRTSTNLFFNQLFGGRNGQAVLGELLSVMLNGSMYTYKVGGPMILMEKEILAQIAKRLNFGENYGATLAPGGSMTNMMALIMARDKKAPEVRFEGLQNKMTLYTSTESHYSVPKNASFAGIGRNQIRFIPTNDNGQMSVEELTRAIEDDISEGHTPFFINATAGSTVYGAFDQIDQVAEVAGRHGIWLHVDGAFGGSVLFSDKYKHLLKGVELCDSFSLNAHKTLGVPLACSMIWARDKQDLYVSFSNEASYLYQTANDDLNPGKISLQCGRRNDALKFWTLWKSIGSDGLCKIVDHQFAMARFARDYVRAHPDYDLVVDMESLTVCFNYKGISARELCNSLYQEGEIMVGFGRFREKEFVRLVAVNFELKEEDYSRFFEQMEAFADSHFG